MYPVYQPHLNVQVHLGGDNNGLLEGRLTSSVSGNVITGYVAKGVAFTPNGPLPVQGPILDAQQAEAYPKSETYFVSSGAVDQSSFVAQARIAGHGDRWWPAILNGPVTAAQINVGTVGGKAFVDDTSPGWDGNPIVVLDNSKVVDLEHFAAVPLNETVVVPLHVIP